MPSEVTPDTFCWLSEARNKKSLTLDLRRKEGAEILRSLIASGQIHEDSMRGQLDGLQQQWLLSEHGTLFIPLVF